MATYPQSSPAPADFEEEVSVHTESYEREFDAGVAEGYVAGLRKAYDDKPEQAPLRERLEIKLDDLVGRTTNTDVERGEVYVYENSDRFY
ncbi:hypothetical protein [Microbulbifer guangxiensis]|uniref:hypothetical protein n=1 Tax=Microbulbifer guangxiensis TaxID=2904249 RepID=UPI001F2D116C|nr:hypothetical protein [Microbulbifer guangxiensis]